MKKTHFYQLSGKKTTPGSDSEWKAGSSGAEPGKYPRLRKRTAGVRNLGRGAKICQSPQTLFRHEYRILSCEGGAAG